MKSFSCYVLAAVFAIAAFMFLANSVYLIWLVLCACWWRCLVVCFWFLVAAIAWFIGSEIVSP